MITDTEIKIRGIKALADAMGQVEAERFVSLIMRDPFDYTEWQKKLWPDQSLEDLSRKAMAHRRQGEPSQ